ncbi:MAG: FAD-dependent oxidoreductase, partial [Actinomycetota bacterium]|nr:FAD-dependent oxidoreductase [Actinomycetota bacterium]
MQHDVDVIVIGLGLGGEAAAGQLAEPGLEVVGGECPYWGCIPSKMMIRTSNLIAETRRVEGIAGTSTVSPDWTNHQIVETEEVPASIIVLGGGAIGAELAQVIRRFGAEVT